MYESFDDKYIVLTTNVESNDFETPFAYLRSGKKTPRFFDSLALAIVELCVYVKDAAMDVHLRLKKKDTLLMPCNFVFGKATLKEDGSLYIYQEPNGMDIYEDEIIYEGDITDLLN